ncbi:hypothetical protein DFP72DRAFT_874881 [Ephemerocybe angulata]|uniref:Transmembrane protein n=1 Tax=Ephemerocybe angulata TaxID=980116 RepID=A0A8H6ICS5_9AGAR|nr:hypothetical protein DFP72DRAFT_874881 [Tulosesus angulatus]
MPNLTLTIEDTSPLLVYSTGWNPGSSRDDDSLELYSDGSYMFTSTQAANVQFVIQGTNFGIYGAKRSSHGAYQISVDNKVYTPVDGKASDPGNFQAALFSSIPLPNVPHTISLANANPGTLVDLDYVTWTVPVGRDDESLIVNTIQDTDSSFKYTPPEAWTTNPNNLGTFSGGSGHTSSQAGAQLQFTFEGDAISLFGPVGPKGATYSVAINVGNALPNNYSTGKIFFRPNNMLYHANNLGTGKHTVTVIVQPGNDTSGESNSLAIDYAQVYTTPSLGGQKVAGDSSNGAVGSSQKAQLSTGAIVGITLGAVLAVISILAIVMWGIFCYIRQRHNRTFFYGFIEKPQKDGQSMTEETARPYRVYASVPAESPPPTAAERLQSQTSYSTLNNTPNTSQWPPSGGQGSSIDPLIPYQPQVPVNANTQELIIPPRGSTEKYRPDRIPQLQPPPQGSRSRQPPGGALSTVSEESSRQNASLMIGASVDDPNPLSAPPPEYSPEQPISSTAASSFYAREFTR